MVVVDTAYRSVERGRTLHARGVVCAIAFMRRRGRKEIPPLLKKLNRLIASVRARVEHLFAWTRNMEYRRRSVPRPTTQRAGLRPYNRKRSPEPDKAR